MEHWWPILFWHESVIYFCCSLWYWIENNSASLAHSKALFSLRNYIKKKFKQLQPHDLWFFEKVNFFELQFVCKVWDLICLICTAPIHCAQTSRILLQMLLLVLFGRLYRLLRRSSLCSLRRRAYDTLLTPSWKTPCSAPEKPSLLASSVSLLFCGLSQESCRQGHTDAVLPQR